nr:hypothetical protein [Micromonospora sp. DSM 115978]
VRQFPLSAQFAQVPAWFWPAALGTIALALVAGPVAVAVPVLVVVALRWPWMLAWVAFAAALASSIGVAVDPNSQPGSGEGAFSWNVQAFGALALAAVIATLATGRWGTDDDGRADEFGALRSHPAVDFG